MPALLHFQKLRSSDKRLLFEALWLIFWIRLCLSTLPFQRVLKLCKRAAKPSGRSYPVARIAWAVRGLSSVIPKATCLTQALATRVLLERQGDEAELRIGVSKTEAKLEAHAWIVYREAILIGDRHDLASYTLLPTLER